MEVPAKVSVLSFVFCFALQLFLLATLFLYFSQSHAVLQGVHLCNSSGDPMTCKSWLQHFEALSRPTRQRFYDCAVLEACAFMKFVSVHHGLSAVELDAAWALLNDDKRADYCVIEDRPYLRTISASIY